MSSFVGVFLLSLLVFGVLAQDDSIRIVSLDGKAMFTLVVNLLPCPSLFASSPLTLRRFSETNANWDVVFGGISFRQTVQRLDDAITRIGKLETDLASLITDLNIRKRDIDVCEQLFNVVC